MADRVRPVFHPGLADYFLGLRNEKEWGQRQTVHLARERGLLALTRQAWIGLETGTTKNPDPDVLRAVAELFDKPYAQIAATVIAATYGLATKDGTGDELGQAGSRTTPDDTDGFVGALPNGRGRATQPLHGRDTPADPDIFSAIDPHYRRGLSDTLVALGAFVLAPRAADLGRVLNQAFRPPRRKPPKAHKRRARNV